MSEQAKDTVTFYCLSCRTKKLVECVPASYYYTLNGRRMTGATCPTCKRRMTRFVKKASP